MHNVKIGTITRTTLLILALINQILEISGASPLPFESDELSEGITTFFTLATSLAAWWKNNSFTKEAVKADEILAKMREENHIIRS